MTITATFGLLSGAGSQSLNNFANSDSAKWLSTISTYNNATGNNHGFYSSSIFSNSAGNDSSTGVSSSFVLGGSYSSTTGYNNLSTFELTGMINGMSSSFYSKGGFGSSLVGNIYNSINNVAVGQGKSVSVFEQRLAYSMGLPGVPETYYPNNYSDEFSLSSSSGSKAGSSYNVFASPDKSSADNKTALKLSLLS